LVDQDQGQHKKVGKNPRSGLLGYQRVRQLSFIMFALKDDLPSREISALADTQAKALKERKVSPRGIAAKRQVECAI
jgi:hypothetical protein